MAGREVMRTVYSREHRREGAQAAAVIVVASVIAVLILLALGR